MSFISRLRRRDPRVGDEVRFHRDRLIEDYIASGVDRRAAERRAFLTFGNLKQIEEACEDVRKQPLDDIRHDLRYAARTLMKHRGFTTAVVFTLALCIGANTTIFTLLNAVVLRALPVRDPEQLVALSDPGASGMMDGSFTGERPLFSYHEFEGLRDQNTVFSGLLASDSQSRPVPIALAPSDHASPATAVLVSGGYFDVLGVRAVQGRTFGAEVDRGLGAHPVAVISYDFWRRRFNGDPAVISRQLRIRKNVLDVVGVLPPSFTGIKVGDAPDVWLPLTMQDVVYTGRDVLTWNPGSITKVVFLQIVGRRKAGMSVAQANAGINLTYQQILAAEAGTISDGRQRQEILNARIAAHDGRRGSSEIRNQYAGPLNVLMGLVGLLLLLACANIANLLLARGAGRYREITVRVALGASRARIVRQLLTEGVLVALVGGAAGLVLSQWANALLLKVVSTGNRPIPLDVHADVAVVAFTVAATALTGVLFSVVPALMATEIDVNQALRAASGASERGDRRRGARLSPGNLLVGVQVAISLFLLVVAGLFVRSLHNLTTVDLGYEADEMLLFRVNPTAAGYRSAAIDPLLRTLTERFSAVPGVRSVTLSENGLFLGRDSGDEISIPGHPARPGQEMQARWDQIGPNYFHTIGIPVLRGRDVTDVDSSGPAVCWVNQTMARYYFGSDNPLGQRIKDEYPETPYNCEIVGVVGDAKYGSVRERMPRRFYVPYFNPIQHPGDATYAVRFAGSSGAVSAGVRRAMAQIDASLDPPEIRTIALQIDVLTMRDRLTAQLSSVVGGLAVLLACLGLYGVMSYNVARRTRELGVRMALGARRAAILGLVLREALAVTLVGATTGLAASAAGTRVMQSLLFGLTARDPRTLAGATILLLVVAACSAALPAWRASRVDPMVALRCE
jgi:predicted permease